MNYRVLQQGFTLVELIVVVLIIGVLSSIAIPSYQEYVRKARRSDAQAALMGLSQAMEIHFSQNSTYTSAITGSAPQPPDIFVAQSPIDGGTAFYNLVVTTVTPTTYTLQAQPIAGTGQANDGVIQLDKLGRRVWDRDNDGTLTEASDLCWSSSC